MNLNIASIRMRIALLLFALFCFTSCTTVHFQTIPPPPPSAKLRVAILPITGDMGRYGQGAPHAEYSKLMFKIVGEHLRNTGIYEVVPQEEVNSVAGEQELDIKDEYWWLRNDCALLKQYGKALYAEYAMLITRSAVSFSALSYKFNIEFINIETGRRYSASDDMAQTGSAKRNVEIAREKIFPNMYKKLFYDVKGDLLATAIRKGRLMPAEEIKSPIKDSVPPAIASAKTTDSTVTQTVSGIKKDKDMPKIIAKTSPSPQSELPAVDKHKGLEKKPEDELQSKTPAKDKTKLVVYDFDAVERLSVVALILTDALREELFRLGNFSLVNRENMMQVLQELKLQKSGLVDEKQIVKIGKWLAANESITGRIAVLGNSYILQAKRTDIETMTTLGFGTLKCTAGQEEALLIQLPELARRLVRLNE